MPCCGNHEHKDHCCGNHQHGAHLVHESQPEVKQPHEKSGKETDKAAGSRQSH